MKLCLRDVPHQQQWIFRDWAALAQHYDDLVCSQKQAADAAKRDIERQVLTFQQTRQGHHTGSEWDLNRPDRFLLDSPAR